MWIETTNVTVRLWPLEYFQLRWRPVRMARHAWQRWTRGFDDTELWCLDWTISRFILPRLVAFRDVGKVGCPAEFVNGEGTDADIEAGQKEFNLLLDKMIYAFECKVDEDKYLPKLEREPCEEGGWHGYRLTKASFGAWQEAHKARQVLIDEGMALFVKYMHCLWD